MEPVAFCVEFNVLYLLQTFIYYLIICMCLINYRYYSSKKTNDLFRRQILLKFVFQISSNFVSN